MFETSIKVNFSYELLAYFTSNSICAFSKSLKLLIITACESNKTKTRLILKSDEIIIQGFFSYINYIRPILSN